MKTFIAVVALGVCAAYGADEKSILAETLPVKFSTSGRGGNLSMDVKEVASSRSIGRNWETDYGSYDRDFVRTKTLAIDLTRFNDVNPTGVTVDVLWIAQKLADKSEFIYSHQSHAIHFSSGQKLLRIEKTMPGLESSVLNLEALGERWVSGSKVSGWVVYLRDRATGNVLRHKSSSPTIERITRGDVAAMLTSYAKNLGN